MLRGEIAELNAGLGGQPGHPGSGRAVFDTSAVDEAVPHFPRACGGCSHELQPVPDGDPVREQIREFPPVEPHVTEHHFHGVLCPHCGKHTVARRTPDMPKGSFGPCAAAAATYLIGAGRLSFVETKRILADLLDFPISTGGLARIAARATKALEAPYFEALGAVRTAGVVHTDETPWYLRGALCRLWIAATKTLWVFKVDPRRTIEARRDVLGDRWLLQERDRDHRVRVVPGFDAEVPRALAVCDVVGVHEERIVGVAHVPRTCRRCIREFSCASGVRARFLDPHLRVTLHH